MPVRDVMTEAVAHFERPQQGATALLLSCARLPIERAETPTVRELALAEQDWRALAGLAFAHRLGPLVDWALERAEVDSAVGGHHRRLLREGRETTAARAVLLTDRVREVLTALHQAAIEAICLKGLSLAEYFYPAPDLRPMADADILVRRQQLDSTTRVLTELGYEIIPPSTVQTVHAVPRPQGTGLWEYSLEIHTEVLSGRLGRRKVRRFTAADLWRGAYPRPVMGAPALAPALEDELLFLCAHLSIHHGDFCLAWLCDLAYLADRSAEKLDWEAFVARSDECGLGPASWAALTAAQGLLDCPVPEPVLRELAPSPRGWDRLRSAIRVAGIVGAEEPPSAWRQVLQRRAFLGTWRDRAWYLLSILAGLLRRPAPYHP